MVEPSVERAVLRPDGRLTIPPEIRRLSGLEEGDLVEFEVVEGRIMIKRLEGPEAEDAWFWTDEWQEGEREVDAEIAAGRTTVLQNTEEFLAWLHRAD